jgi:hypothetical protein
MEEGRRTRRRESSHFALTKGGGSRGEIPTPKKILNGFCVRIKSFTKWQYLKTHFCMGIRIFLHVPLIAPLCFLCATMFIAGIRASESLAVDRSNSRIRAIRTLLYALKGRKRMERRREPANSDVITLGGTLSLSPTHLLPPPPPPHLLNSQKAILLRSLCCPRG